MEDSKREEADATRPQEVSGAQPETEKKTEVVMTEKEAQAKRDAEEDMQYPHGLKLWIILGALCLAVFLVALDQTIISTAIPKITDRFKSIQDIGW